MLNQWAADRWLRHTGSMVGFGNPMELMARKD